MDLAKYEYFRTDIICDPFLGSGTTALVAEQYGRKWIGIELSTEYAKMAVERIKSATAQRKLF